MLQTAETEKRTTTRSQNKRNATIKQPFCQIMFDLRYMRKFLPKFPLPLGSVLRSPSSFLATLVLSSSLSQAAKACFSICRISASSASRRRFHSSNSSACCRRCISFCSRLVRNLTDTAEDSQRPPKPDALLPQFPEFELFQLFSREIATLSTVSHISDT